MGCDIHLFVETREPGGPWKLTPVFRECDDCKGTAIAPEGYRDAGGPCWFCRKNPGKKPGYHDRNYDVFAMLAGVRNGRGFAGLSTGDGFNPISEPRGLPADLGPELTKRSERDDEDAPWETWYETYGTSWLGDHSHSWLSLEELLKYNWDQRTAKSGWISLEEFRKWDAKGGGWPEAWSGGISGQRIKHVSNAEMRLLISAGRVEDENNFHEDHHYTSVRWEDTYARCARTFHDKFIPALMALGKPTTDVRIVFGFDS